MEAYRRLCKFSSNSLNYTIDFCAAGLKGGGKNVMSSISKTNKGANYKERMKCIQDTIANKTYQSDALKEAQAIRKHIAQNLEHGDQIFKAAVASMTVEQSREGLKIITASGRNYGSTESKVEKLCSVFLGRVLGNLKTQENEIDELRKSILSGMIPAYTCWCFKGSKFNNTLLVQMLENHLNSLSAQASGSDAMDDLSKMLSNSSI